MEVDNRKGELLEVAKRLLAGAQEAVKLEPSRGGGVNTIGFRKSPGGIAVKLFNSLRESIESKKNGLKRKIIFCGRVYRKCEECCNTAAVCGLWPKAMTF